MGVAPGSVAGDEVSASLRSFLASCIRAPKVFCTGTPFRGAHGLIGTCGLDDAMDLDVDLFVEAGNRS